MLLRVDVYPNTLPIDAVSNKLPAPVQSLLVSLNTASSSTVVTVGRKDALITFGADKSVSRQHMTLELVSSQKLEPLDGKPLPRSPQGTVEMDACATNDMICVLNDTSKFGTYLIAPGDQGEATTKNNDDDTTADDETDDEGHAVSQPNPSQLSSVATKLIDPSGAKLVKVEGPLVLTNLCRPHSQVIIQVGQNGSTLVIQHVPYRMALSRVSAKIKDLWSSRCYLLGVTFLETLDESMTHLVTVDRITNAKSLTAWCLSKPLVTVDFLDAIWNRKSPTDPLPDATKYETQEPKDGLTFWKERPNPKLWSHTTMLSFDPKTEDMEALCRAAGATIIALNQLENPLQAIDEAVAKGGCFYLQSNSRSHGKILKHLKSLKVQSVTQKSIALYVSRQEPLKDTNLVDIGSAIVDGGDVNEHAIRQSLQPPMATKVLGDLKSTPVRTSREKEAPTDEEDYGDNALPTRSRRNSRQVPSREERLVEETSQPQQTLPMEEDDEEDDLPKTISRSQRRVSQRLSSNETAQSQKSRLLPTLDDNDDEDDDDEEPPKIVSRLHRASRETKIPRKLEEDDAEEEPPKIVSRSQRASRVTATPSEGEDNDSDQELPRTLSRSQRVSGEKLSLSKGEDVTKLPKILSRSQRASEDKNNDSDEELPKIVSRSQRGSRVMTPSRKDENDSDDELPKIVSRSQRASRVTTTPRNHKNDEGQEEIPNASSLSQRARGRRTPREDEDDDSDEELPKKLTRSQRASRETKTSNKGDVHEEIQQGSTVSRPESEIYSSNKDVNPSLTSQKRSLQDDAEDDNNDEMHVQASKRPKRSIGGWTDVRKISRVGESQSNNNDADNDDISVSDTGDQHRVRKRAEFRSKMALQKTKDGWLVAAPRDRTAFKATEAEILDTLGNADEVPPTAETDVIDGLCRSIRGQPKSPNPATGTVVDFRRFRKNSVIRGGERLCRIQMRVVLPKASDRQAELEDEQAALEASLREADMLFQDRSGGGGILGHFKVASRRRTREV